MGFIQRFYYDPISVGLIRDSFTNQLATQRPLHLFSETVNSMLKFFIFVILGWIPCVFLVGCATPQLDVKKPENRLTMSEIKYHDRLRLQTILNYQKELEIVNFRLAQAALPFCDQKKNSYTGLYVSNIDAWPLKHRRLAREMFNLDEELSVQYVVPKSPAANAGIKEGDLILAVEHLPVITGRGATRDFFHLLDNQATKLNPSIAITVLQNDQTKIIKVSPQQLCYYPVTITTSNSLNAFANGKLIGVTTGLMRFVENQNELALIIAHEIAHNALHHIDAKKHNYVMGSFIDLLASAYGIESSGVFGALSTTIYSKQFEREADYLGMYIAARAGFDISETYTLWDRMAAENLAANDDSALRSHPISAERSIALQQAAEEITEKLKIQSRDRLLPR